MRRVLGASALLLAFVLTTACEEPPAKPPAPKPVTWHRDVGPLLKEKCDGCHVEGGIAPFALRTYAQAHARLEAIKAEVVSRRMPPWPPSRDCGSYRHDRSLTDAQVSLLARWVDEGGVEGDASEAPLRNEKEQEGLSRVDVRLELPEAYTPGKSPDDYRCFLLDWPYTDRRYVTGFRADPDNGAIVHHVIAFLARPGDVAKAQALDDQEPGPGYTCFGGPGFSNPAWLGSWAPGSLGSDYPTGTGLPVEPGSRLVLQVHYHTSHGGVGEDRTGVSLKVDSSVDKVAVIQPWLNPAWVSGGSMRIPAGEADVRHRFSFDPTPFLSQITGGLFRNGEPITLHATALHMHTLGSQGSLSIERAGGGEECLLDIPDWDFHWQGLYDFSEPRVVAPGDAIALECRWDNSAPGAVDVAWGEGTEDEMCLGLFYMTQ